MRLNKLIVLLSLRSGYRYVQKKACPIQPLAFTQVHLNDLFWAPKAKVHARVNIPYTSQQYNKDERIDNFLDASKTVAGDKLSDSPFDDTDIDSLIISSVLQKRAHHLHPFGALNASKPHD